MLVQKFLQDGGTLEMLQKQFAINIRRHAQYANLVSFKYDMVDSPMCEPIVRQCRGLVLDEADNWRTICWPFNKFNNFGEQLSDTIDWNSARVQTKLDGSLCSIYFYYGKWHVSTSGSPDAAGKVGSESISFKELFWATFKDQGLTVPLFTKADFNFMFELTTPLNRVVVPYKDRKITLIGIRNRFSGQEHKISDAKQFGVDYPTVQEHSLTTIDDVMSASDKLNPMEQEGYVVVDKDFNRIKIKNFKYVIIHHQRDNFSRKRMLELIKINESEEFLVYYPEMRDEHDKIKASLDLLVDELDIDYHRIKASIDTNQPKNVYRKAFAGKALRTKCPGAMFNILDGRVTNARTYLYTMDTNNLLGLLNIENKMYGTE